MEKKKIIRKRLIVALVIVGMIIFDICMIPVKYTCLYVAVVCAEDLRIQIETQLPRKDEFDEEWLVGKSREEIEEKHGPLDSYELVITDDGTKLYRARYYLTYCNSLCGRYLWLTLDENEIVMNLGEEVNHPGG